MGHQEQFSAVVEGAGNLFEVEQEQIEEPDQQGEIVHTVAVGSQHFVQGEERLVWASYVTEEEEVAPLQLVEEVEEVLQTLLGQEFLLLEEEQELVFRWHLEMHLPVEEEEDLVYLHLDFQF